MSRDETPLWPRGSTYFGVGGTTDANSSSWIEGKEWRFEDSIYNTGQYVTVRAVRNSSGISLLPSRTVGFDPSFFGQRVNGYTTTTAAPGFPVDELLPAAGVAANDIFYVVVDGPAAVLVPLDAGADNVINVGDLLVAITAATSQATTAGRVATISAASTNAPSVGCNVIGRAMSAATTANTTAPLLAFVNRWL